MPVLFQRIIVRSDLRNNPHVMYLFGDNELRKGMGGQAKEMRGEPNAIGIPTKRAPYADESSYWSDADYDRVEELVYQSFWRPYWHIQSEGVVIIPSDGLGTGRAELPTRAPKIMKLIEEEVGKLIAADKTYNDNQPSPIKE